MPGPTVDLRDHHGMGPYARQFLDWFSAMGISSATVDIRRQMLRRFMVWCADRGLDQPQEITRPILERYRWAVYHERKADQRPWSFGTQQLRLVPLKAIFKWLAKHNYLLSNPASELELPRRHWRLPRHLLTPAEVERILAQTHLHGVLGIRDRAHHRNVERPGVKSLVESFAWSH